MNKKKQNKRVLRRVYAGLCLASSLVFLISAGTTLAKWKKTDETVSTLSVGVVRGRIVDYDDDVQTMAVSQTVEKSACIQNQGDLDACVRVKVNKYWGRDRDSEGRLVRDDDLPVDNIVIGYNTDDWYTRQNDDYLYYKGIVAPGEKTHTIFNSFTIEDMADRYVNSRMTADVTVEMEMVQAAGDGLSYWNISPDQLGIESLPEQNNATSSQVVFNSPEKGFTFTVEDGSRFMSFKMLSPGCSRMQELKLSNQWSDGISLFLRAEKPGTSDKDSEAFNTLVNEYLRFTVADKQGVELNSGPVGKAFEEALPLGVLAANEQKDLNVNLYFDSRADNAVAGLAGDIKWVFVAEGDDDQKSKPTDTGDGSHFHIEDSPNDPVKTGDTNYTVVLFFISGVSFIVFLIFISKIRRLDNKTDDD